MPFKTNFGPENAGLAVGFFAVFYILSNIGKKNALLWVNGPD